MSKIELDKNEIKYTKNITAFSTLGLAIISLIGLIFIVYELKELRNQNILLEESITQTYRPIGAVFYTLDDLRTLILEYRPAKSVDKFSITGTHIIVNLGEGVLNHIGKFSYLSTEELNFREDFLEGKFDSLDVDYQYSYTRIKAILPYAKRSDSFLGSNFVLLNIPFESKYFYYSLYLYEDQEGNLYDTEHLEVWNFEEPQIVDSLLQTNLLGDSFLKDSYHSYNKDEKRKLISAIRKLDKPKNHPIAEIINR